LLASLNETSAKASIINSALVQGQALSAKLDAQRAAFQPLAASASALFFLLQDLSALDSMYSFSLSGFLQLFHQVFQPNPQQASALQAGRAMKKISSQIDANAVSDRISELKTLLVQLVYTHVSRALFNKDRLVFALHVARHVTPGLCSQQEWDLFVSRGLGSAELLLDPSGTKGSSRSGSANSNTGTAAVAQHSSVGAPVWLLPDTVGAYTALLEALPDIAAAANLQDASIWGQWVMAPAGAATGSNSSIGSGVAAGQKLLVDLVPARVAGRLTAFQALLMVKLFKPDG
jgi:hypothetical protein